MPQRRSGGGEVLLVRSATAAVFIALLARTWADPDLWGHLRFGGDMLAGGVGAPDPYTFTGLGRWVNPSWLADVLMYVVWAWGGTPGLVAGKLAVALGIVAVTGCTLWRGGVRGPALELLLLLCIAVIYPSALTVRPQLLALLLFAMLLSLQASEPPRWAPRIVVIPVLMALWANLHGSWVLGLAEVGIWSAGELVSRGGSARERVRIAATAIVAALATGATPHGTALWWQLSDAMSPTLQDVSEWRSLLETSAPLVVIWLALAAGAAAVVVRRGGRPSHVLVLVWLAWASWRVSRLLQFFGLATLAFLGPRLVAGREGRAAARRGDAAPGRAVRIVLAAASLVLIVGSAVATARSLMCLRIDHTREADMRAAAFIARNHLEGRLLSYSDWGLYAIWHFAPALRVSLDGRREFAYPKPELARHGAIYWNAPTAFAEIDALAPGYVWLPRSLPVTAALAASGRWSPIFETDRSVVFARPERAASGSWLLPSPAAALPGCFPGDPPP